MRCCSFETDVKSALPSYRESAFVLPAANSQSEKTKEEQKCFPYLSTARVV